MGITARQVNDSLSHDRDLIWSHVITFNMDLFTAGMDDVWDFSLLRDYNPSLISRTRFFS